MGAIRGMVPLDRLIYLIIEKIFGGTKFKNCWK